MKIKPLKRFNSKESEVTNSQKAADVVLNKIINKEVLNGQLIKGLQLTSGTDLNVKHKLGREPKGYIILNADNDVIIYQDTSPIPKREILLKADPIVIRTYDVNDWIAYTPTWTGAIADPTIGNGILEGHYKIVGDSVDIKIQIRAGNTTGFGNGAYVLGIPAALTVDTTKYNNAALYVVGSGGLHDNGVARYTGHVFWTGTGLVLGWWAANDWSSGGPFAFGNTDECSIYVTGLPITGHTAHTDTTTYPVVNFDIWVF